MPSSYPEAGARTQSRTGCPASTYPLCGDIVGRPGAHRDVEGLVLVRCTLGLLVADSGGLVLPLVQFEEFVKKAGVLRLGGGRPP